MVPLFRKFTVLFWGDFESQVMHSLALISQETSRINVGKPLRMDNGSLELASINLTSVVILFSEQLLI